MNIPLYPRGFIFAQDEISLPAEMSHFTQVQTNRGTLWVSPESEYGISEQSEKTVVVVGHAHFVNFDESLADMTLISRKVLQNWSTRGLEGVHELLYDLAGRYAVFLVNDETCHIYQDAHGMRSVYYVESGRLAASHERMLADLTSAVNGKSVLATAPLPLRWSMTRYIGIKALLPNHRLDLSSGKTYRFFPKSGNPYIGLPTKDRVEMVHYLWSTQLKSLASRHTLALSMTGGLDSRTSLAMSREVWDAVRAFTYTATPLKDNAWTRSIYKDEVIVRQLLQVVSVNHRFLHRDDSEAFTVAETRVLEKNSAGQHGRWLLKLYREQVSGENVVHLRGNLNETARNYFHNFVDLVNPLDGLRKLMKNQLETRVANIAPSLANTLAEVETEIHAASFEELDETYTPLDMYYWEARQGRWFSEVFNETDWAFETVIPFNHRRIIDLALSFTAQERKNGLLFRELINRNAPFLNFFGVNNIENVYEQNRRKEKATDTDSSSLELFMHLTDPSGTEVGKVPFKGQLYLPAAQFRRDHASTVTYRVSDLADAGGNADLTIVVENNYENYKASDYFALEVLLDDEIVAQHDLAYWPEPFNISITDVAEGASLSIRISSRREIPRASWEKASRTRLRVSARPTSRQGRRILTNNPFVVINK